jgi:prepilin-type N-terminal cleavage/methylation domain-containing protein
MKKFSIFNFQFSKNEECNRFLQAGFTIIEILVTIFVFSVLITVVIAIFVRATALERRIVSVQRIQENAMFIIESMAKEIRVSDIGNQDSPTCTATTLTMIHPIYGTITYSRDVNGNIQRQAGGLTRILSSSDVQFTRMNFCISGSGLTDQLSPRVTILLSLRNRTGVIVSADLQTTITSRNITSELEN